MTEPRIEDTKNEISCALAKGVLMYVQRQYGEGALNRLVGALGLPFDYMLDGSNWMSFDCFNRLLRLLVEQTGKPNAAYEAGLFGTRPAVFGVLRVIAGQLLNVRSVYRLACLYERRYSKVAQWTIRETGMQSAVLELRYHPAYTQTRLNCDVVRAGLCTMPQWVGRPPARVRHTQCIVDGAEACRYEISWYERPGYLVALTGGLAGTAILAFLVAHAATPMGAAGLPLLLLPVVGFALGHLEDMRHAVVATRTQNEEEAQALMESIQKIEELNAELQQRVERRTQELNEANARLTQTLQELKESQERLLVSEKQAAVGVLAAGMAHEVNNPANAIRLALQDVIEDVAPDSPLRRRLENALRATARCKRIVEELLTFSREPTRHERVGLERIVADTVALFKKEEGTNELTIAEEIVPGLPDLQLDRMQIQQSILNVLANARDATCGKGHIRIALGREGPQLVLAVSDDGPGMSEDVRKRIFDPFFTTKAPGRGAGLGLSISYQLVRRNGGTIDLMTEQNKGTTFFMRFPVESAPPLLRPPEGGG